jgi:ADP-heptose:LPS heptosyltransferase
MIYVLFTGLFYPFLYIIALLKKKTGFRKILVIQTAKIGDLICSTPVFREIKKQYPAVRLSVIANPVATELLKYNPHVDKIISLDTKTLKGILGKLKLIRLLYSGKYDICISLNPNIPFTIAPIWSLIPVRAAILPDYLGATLKMALRFNTHNVRHEAKKLVLETYMDILKTIGIKTGAISKEVYKSPDADKRVEAFLSGFPGIRNNLKIGIAVSSGNKLKELGKDTIVSLISKLTANPEVKIILIGSQADKNSSREILNMSDNKNIIIDTAGMFNLNELPALLEQLSLFIGVDTGITYMADALSVPLIDIAGPSDMSDQRPMGKNSVIIQKNIPCVPCSHAFKTPYSCERNDRDCITSVSVSEIFDRAKKLLETSKTK